MDNIIKDLKIDLDNKYNEYLKYKEIIVSSNSENIKEDYNKMMDAFNEYEHITHTLLRYEMQSADLIYTNFRKILEEDNEPELIKG